MKRPLRKHMRRRRSSQKGQGFSGYILVALAVLILAVVLQKNLIRIRQGGVKSQYRDLAIEVARSGFVSTHAWFRRHASTLSTLTPISITDTSQPYAWPDDAFRPQKEDTDYYDQLSGTAYDGSPVAQAIVRTIPLHLTGPAEATSTRLWGRYVVKRQHIRNFTPNANTASANTDPEAVHDLSGMRSAGGMAGGGSVWGITSRSYIFFWPTDLTDTSLLEGGTLMGKPLDVVPDTYPNPLLRGKRLLVASAKVYGEVIGLKIMPHSLDTPLQVNQGSNVTISGSKAIVDGSQAGRAIARRYGDATMATVSGGTLLPTTGTYVNWSTPGGSPSLANIFPGFSINDLANIADYVGDISIFPDHNVSPGSPAYEEFKRRVATMTFYFLNGNATFPSSEIRRMLGVGLVFVNGDLTIQNGNASDFAGIVYVNGNVSIASGSISGILIATGKVFITGGTVLNTRITSNRELVTNVRDWIFAYRVNKASVITR